MPKTTDKKEKEVVTPPAVPPEFTPKEQKEVRIIERVIENREIADLHRHSHR